MKPPIEMKLDGVTWKPIETAFSKMGLDDLPCITHEGTLNIDTLELTVYQLDDGRRIIPEESMAKFLQWLETGRTDR